MLPDGTIAAGRVWKRFHADRTRPVLRDEIERLRNRGQGGPNRWRWALRDIDFHVSPGEAVGLFGANGSGKSTLLKILTRVMYPTAGKLEVSGRVGALIEVKAGIHPDLTGRENVFLYGSLLGLKRGEVAARFDEIVEFAELADAVDRQVKFYSSGMAMRLGFAVAAFLNPDILLVDEVLAVGDASFQQKCLSRMQQVLAQGTTLVFVSHDLATIEATCDRGVWLDGGVVAADGPIREALAAYRAAIEHAATLHVEGALHVREAVVDYRDDDLVVRLDINAADAASAVVHLGVSEGTAAPMFTVRHDIEVRAGEGQLACVIRGLPLPGGRFYLWGTVVEGRRELLPWQPLTAFDVGRSAPEPAPPGVTRLTPFHPMTIWSGTGGVATPSAATSRG